MGGAGARTDVVAQEIATTSTGNVAPSESTTSPFAPWCGICCRSIRHIGSARRSTWNSTRRRHGGDADAVSAPLTAARPRARSNRPVAKTALRWRGSAFPSYFSSFLHPYLNALGEVPAAPNELLDARLDKLYQDFALIAVQLGFPHDLSAPAVTSGASALLRLRARGGGGRARPRVGALTFTLPLTPPPACRSAAGGGNHACPCP